MGSLSLYSAVTLDGVSRLALHLHGEEPATSSRTTERAGSALCRARPGSSNLDLCHAAYRCRVSRPGRHGSWS